MTHRKRAELLEKGRRMLLSGNVPVTVYTDKLWDEAQAARQAQAAQHG